MRRLTIHDLMAVERLYEVELSPSGDFAFLCTKEIKLDENSSTTKNYRLDLRNEELLPINLGNSGASGFSFSRDGKYLFYACDAQVYMAKADGSRPRCLTSGVGGASNPVVSADGTCVLFSREYYADRELQAIYESKGRIPSLADSHKLQHPLAEARIADSLLYRHWDQWIDNRINGVFLHDLRTNETRLLTRGFNAPPLALGSRRDYDFSPQGDEIVFTANPDKFLANSTNNSIYRLKLTQGSVAELISNSQACDTHPRYLDENTIAYLAMIEAGSESDYNRIKVYDSTSKQTRTYLEDFERSPEEFHIFGDKKLLFCAQDFAHSSFYTLNLESGEPNQLTSASTYSAPSISKKLDKILCIKQSLCQASECVELTNFSEFSPLVENGKPEIRSKESCRILTNFSEPLEQISLHPGESLWYAAKDGTILEGYVVLPPDYDEKKKYSVILLIHGGPQGAFQDSFHYRWNVQMFAATGAITIFCNPRGSTGYGRKITQEISGDWSGKCPDDILSFVDAVFEKYPQADPERLSAAGASFGGYMINYFLGHSNRFKAFVSHDGIFHSEVSAYATDELWFMEKEFGAKPFDNPELFLKHSPHKGVKNYKTPTLVIHGELDYRCTFVEGAALFTALQYMGVPSRFLTFPNEGHWVLKPANAQQWYHEVLSWIKKYAG